MLEAQIKDAGTKIIDMCQRLHAKDMLAAADGNLSCRLDDGTFLMTPSGMNKSFITVDDLTLMDQDGRALRGRPSSEYRMHLTVYRQCPEAKWVVHAHPPHAIAWSLSRPDLKELPSAFMPEVILAAGKIPFVPYAVPGTQEFGDVLRPYLPDHRVMVLSRHGALSWGPTMMDAYNGMERVEHAAKILHLAHQLGEPKPLPESDLKILWAKRQEIGDRIL